MFVFLEEMDCLFGRPPWLRGRDKARAYEPKGKKEGAQYSRHCTGVLEGPRREVARAAQTIAEIAKFLVRGHDMR